jgi:hypothetical protein
METGDKLFLFIVGLHRSGTSLLHAMLADHPAISGFHDTGAVEDEGQFLQSVYPPGREFGGPGRFGLDRHSHMDETHPLCTPDGAERLWRDWSRYWDTRRPCLMEKSPPNVVRTRFLQAMFPRSAFVIILRHPIAVSYATLKWCPTTIPSLVEHWLACHERLLADLPHLDRAYVLHYCDLVQRPQETIDRVLEFLGLDPVPIRQEVDANVNAAYFDRWRRDHPGLLGQFFNGIPWPQYRRVARFGYSLVRPDRRKRVPCLGPHVRGKP